MFLGTVSPTKGEGKTQREKIAKKIRQMIFMLMGRCRVRSQKTIEYTKYKGDSRNVVVKMLEAGAWSPQERVLVVEYIGH